MYNSIHDVRSLNGEERQSGMFNDQQACFRACLKRRREDPVFNGATFGMDGKRYAKQCYCEKNMYGRHAETRIFTSAFLDSSGIYLTLNL